MDLHSSQTLGCVGNWNTWRLRYVTGPWVQPVIRYRSVIGPYCWTPSPTRSGTGEPLHLESVPVRGSFPPVGQFIKWQTYRSHRTKSVTPFPGTDEWEKKGLWNMLRFIFSKWFCTHHSFNVTPSFTWPSPFFVLVKINSSRTKKENYIWQGMEIQRRKILNDLFNIVHLTL